MRLSAEKKLPTVIVGRFSLREKAPTKNRTEKISSLTSLFTQVSKAVSFYQYTAHVSTYSYLAQTQLKED